MRCVQEMSGTSLSPLSCAQHLFIVHKAPHASPRWTCSSCAVARFFVSPSLRCASPPNDTLLLDAVLDPQHLNGGPFLCHAVHAWSRRLFFFASTTKILLTHSPVSYTLLRFCGYPHELCELPVSLPFLHWNGGP